MPDNNDFVQINALGRFKVAVQILRKIYPGGYIQKRSGVAASNIADTAIFKVPAGDACLGESLAQIAGAFEGVLAEPSTAVDDNN